VVNNYTPISPPGLLIVDDEPTILELLRTICQRRGFKVYSAPDGRKGAEVFRANSDRITLVLLDVRMPEMDGPATLAELRRIEANVACCFMSGDLGHHTPEELDNLGVLRLFPKPFKILELTEELWDLARQEAKQSA
jgi:two-component system, cell cycle sensor histidine kinase and response regulator CckA